MDRSVRKSTALQRPDAANKKKEQLARKLFFAAQGGRLPNLLKMLQEGKFGSTECTIPLEFSLGSTILECIHGKKIRQLHGADGLLSAVKCLHQHGANMSAVDRCGQDLITLACSTGDTELVHFVIDNTEPGPNKLTFQDTTRPHEPRLFMVCKANPVEISELLLEYGADISERGYNGTPLIYHHVAAMYGYPLGVKVKLIRFLIEMGCDVNSHNIYGTTALHVGATRYGNPEILRLLLKKGADVNAVGMAGRTPLHWAVESGRMDLVEILSDCGADILKKDVYMHTPLDYARMNVDIHMDDDSRDDDQILECLNTEQLRRSITEAWAMGQHPRLGELSAVHTLSPEMARLVLEVAELVNHIEDPTKDPIEE